jgi:hypothetical protein
MREPALGLLEIPAARRLVVSAEIAGDLLVPDPVGARQDRLPEGHAALPPFQELLGLLLVIGPVLSRTGRPCWYHFTNQMRPGVPSRPFCW